MGISVLAGVVIAAAPLGLLVFLWWGSRLQPGERRKASSS